MADIQEGTLTAANGRKYTKQKDALKDFDDGKDFRWSHYTGFTYCSIRDYKPGQTAKLRWGGCNQHVVFRTVPEFNE